MLRFISEGCGAEQIQAMLQRSNRENEAGEKEDGRSQEKLDKVNGLGVSGKIMKNLKTKWQPYRLELTCLN